MCWPSVFTNGAMVVKWVALSPQSAMVPRRREKSLRPQRPSIGAEQMHPLRRNANRKRVADIRELIARHRRHHPMWANVKMNVTGTAEPFDQNHPPDQCVFR